jgi:hypothetical protein
MNGCDLSRLGTVMQRTSGAPQGANASWPLPAGDGRAGLSVSRAGLVDVSCRMADTRSKVACLSVVVGALPVSIERRAK